MCHIEEPSGTFYLDGCIVHHILNNAIPFVSLIAGICTVKQNSTGNQRNCLRKEDAHVYLLQLVTIPARGFSTL